jgi:hypothetical protein
MAHYAKIENNIVTNIIVAEQDFINTLQGEWIQTSFNTYGGIHKLGGTPLRKNYASIGMLYDRKRDAFRFEIPFSSWNLNEDSCIWEPPIPLPQDGNIYYWNENQLNWELKL